MTFLLASADTSAFGTHATAGITRKVLPVTRRMPYTWVGRRVAYALRQIAIWSLRGQPVDVEALGARMRLYPYNNVCEKRLLFTPQFFDPEELAFLETRVKPGFVFVDVGANVGGYSLFVARLAGGGGRVLSVEPQPHIFERLVYNIRQNASGTVKALDCAVADKTGEVTLFVDPGNAGESSVKIMGAVEGKAIRVPAKTLMQLLQDEGFDHVDAMKIDVEGAEDLILEPFLRDAPESLWPPLLVIENGAGRWQVDLVGLLGQKGWRLVKKTRVNLIFERPAAPASRASVS
ncbi:MAG: FkbM family methyltransferase [Alsobacter sp.]